MNTAFLKGKTKMFMDIEMPRYTTVGMNLMLERLRELVRRDSRSEAYIARQLGLSERRFNHYISGARRFPVEYIGDVCRVLDTHPNYLFGWSNQRHPDSPSRGDRTAALETEIRRLQRILSNFRTG